MTNDESLQIDTPENVAFDYHVAGIGSRFVAALVDTLLIVILQVLIFGTLILILVNTGLDLESSSFSAWLIGIFGLISFLFLWGYYIFFEMLWNGQSPGKRWLGLRVIRMDGTPISLTESLIRNLVRIVDFLPAAYGFGVVTMFINSQSRRLGDLAAGTLVVHENAPISVQALGVMQVNAWHKMSLKPVSATDFPVERLNSQEVHLIEEFLQRHEEMQHRQQLAFQILSRLYQRAALPLESMDRMEAEDKLIAILEAVRKRTSGN
jgi:uncharacterized RDD family membrane protein YckC